MERDRWFHRPVFYIVMVLYFLLGYSTLGWGTKWAAILYPEDHYFENVGAISLFIASGISLYVFIRAYQNRRATGTGWFKLLVYLGLALLFFFGAGEEISWGQRIFHIQEPAALARENTQRELNLHDLAVFEDNPLLKSDNVFTVFWMLFTVVIPAATLLSSRLRRFAEIRLPIVYPPIGALFLVNYFFAKLAGSYFRAGYSYQLIPFAQAVQEIKESNYELMFVFLSLVVLWELNRTVAAARQTEARLDEATALPHVAASESKR